MVQELRRKTLLVGGAERQRRPVQPSLEEHVDRGGPQRVADPLQQAGIGLEANPLDSSVLWADDAVSICDVRATHNDPPDPDFWLTCSLRARDG